MSIPPDFTDTEAAATPEVFLTAYLNLFELGVLRSDHTVLVHGGSGGVGTAAIQLATMAGARILITAGSDERCRRCAELGAFAAINYRTEDFVQRTRDSTDGRGVDLVLDCIGAAYFEKNLDVLATDGRIVIIGWMGGSDATLDLGRILRRRLTIIGSTLRSRTPADKGRIIRGFLDRFGHELESGTIRPVLDRTLPLEDASLAHRLLASGEIFGKVVLTTE
jgi:NADPH:quinone reductase-like Zn-dependent oxidoreductase